MRTQSLFTSINGILVTGAEQSSKFRMECVRYGPKDEGIKRVRNCGVWLCGKVWI
jgi:hypothetical protein